jgi:uncharacterized protein (DUF2062 family)
MLIGSLIIATPITLVTYFVVKRLAERWARRKKRLDDKVE